MARSPSSERYRQRIESREIVATRMAQREARREGTSHRMINAYHGDAPLGMHRWTNLHLNLSKPILRSKRAYTV
jgi:hypothetical protein